jgi:predicted PurR-regulated permease PerM
VALTQPPRFPAGERIRRAGLAAWSIIGIAIVIAGALWLLLKIRIILPPLVLALVIIYLVNPIVSRFERRGIRRSIAAILSYILVVGALVLLVVALAPFVSNQVSHFTDEWPSIRQETALVVEDVADSIEQRTGIRIETESFVCLLGADVGGSAEAPSEERCDRLTERFREQIADQAGRLTEIGLGLLEAALVVVIAPLLALYMVIDLPQIQRDLLGLVPEPHREEAADLASKVGRAVGGFFRGQLFVAFTVGVMAAVGFGIIGLEFWFLIGAIAGITNLIPLVGPFIGGGLGFLVGTMTDGIGKGLLAALVALIVQQIDNHFISPQVMSRTVKLHPATVMLSLLAGGTLAGFWGVLLGVPTVAVVKLLSLHFWTTRVLGEEPTPFAGTAVATAGASENRVDAGEPRDDRG